MVHKKLKQNGERAAASNRQFISFLFLIKPAHKCNNGYNKTGTSLYPSARVYSSSISGNFKFILITDLQNVTLQLYISYISCKSATSVS